MFICPGLIIDGIHTSCTRDPVECDHIIEIRHAGKDMKSNLQMLCTNCHKRKTIANYHSQIVF